MSELLPGKYIIVSAIDDNLITSVPPPIKRGFAFNHYQYVSFQQSCRIWKLSAALQGNGTFLFNLGAYDVTGVHEDQGVIVSQRRQDEPAVWHVTLHKDQNAYTIELNDNRNTGWTSVSFGTHVKTVAIEQLRLGLQKDQLFTFIRLPDDAE